MSIAPVASTPVQNIKPPAPVQTKPPASVESRKPAAPAEGRGSIVDKIT